jgi:opacity protein-like surface antigen
MSRIDAGRRRREFSVKRSLAAAALALALACAASPALAQVYGIMNDAKVVPVNGHLGGGYLQFDKSSATLMGQLRLSLYPNMDFGFVGGLSRIDIENDNQTSVRLATDFRGQITNQSADFPVSITLGAAIALESADGFSLLSVGPTAAASRVLDQANQWTATFGASLLLSRSEINGDRNTDTSLPLRLGLQYAPNPDIRIMSEAQVGVSDEIRDDFSLMLGVLFPF